MFIINFLFDKKNGKPRPLGRGGGQKKNINPHPFKAGRKSVLLGRNEVCCPLVKFFNFFLDDLLNKMSKRTLLILFIGLVAAALSALLVITMLQRPKLQILFSTTLKQTLPGTFYPNTRYFLPPNKIVFQLLPGSTGDYAVLINPDGSVSTLPDNTTISFNVDYSKITGYSTIPGLIAFGGGEETSQPWSQCATPCSPYVAFYNTLSQQLSIIKIPGGSCDNMNTSSIVSGNNNDIIVIGGANPGTRTGGTGYVIFTPSLTYSLFGTFSLTDSIGNTLYLYKMPKITVGNTLYLVAGINSPNTLAIESIPLQLLYTKGDNDTDRLCETAIITPNYITTIGNDLNYGGVLPIYTDGINIYLVYYSSDGYVKLVTFNTTTNTVTSVKQLIQLPNNNLMFAIANGYVYVSVQKGNSFNVYKFNFNGDLIASESFTGTGFVDMNGYIVQFVNGLNAGSKINVYTPL